MKLIPVDPDNAHHVSLLYQLLAERPPEANISHKEMPLPAEHAAFVAGHPYLAWYIIERGDTHVGAIYITHKSEIGVGILRAHQNYGAARHAILELAMHHSGPFLANINPANTMSIKLFEGLGFQHIQNTYRL